MPKKGDLEILQIKGGREGDLARKQGGVFEVWLIHTMAMTLSYVISNSVFSRIPMFKSLSFIMY